MGGEGLTLIGNALLIATELKNLGFKNTFSRRLRVFRQNHYATLAV